MSWNSGAENLTGYSAEDAVGGSRDDLLGVWEESPSADLVTRHRDRRADPEDPTAMVRMARKDGTEAWVRWSSNMISQGKLRAFVYVVHDVTAARQADQLKSDFVATISHELRTPLTPLKGFLATLLQGLAILGHNLHTLGKLLLRQQAPRSPAACSKRKGRAAAA